MPKIIDHANRKEKIAEATYRIICKNGLENATVRNIAKEAGLSMGAMRYYFINQGQLYIYCMELINKRFGERIYSLEYPEADPPLDHIKRILGQLLPLDEERKLEMEVWMSFNVKSLSDAELQPISNRMYEDIYKIISFVFDLMSQFGILKPDLNIPIEIERLYALVDGLGLHYFLNPKQNTLERIDLVLTQHLELLCISTNGKVEYPKENAFGNVI